MSAFTYRKFDTYHAPFAFESCLAQRLAFFWEFIYVVFQALGRTATVFDNTVREFNTIFQRCYQVLA